MRAKAKLGQMYYAIDSRLLFKDNGNSTEQRLVFNAVVVRSENERLNSIKPVVGKFYYVEETNSLWLFDTRWVLKIGKDTIYNTYYANEYISPVINTNETISGLNGDKIIDNNGLLGNGAVVIRDTERITRGLHSSNLAYNRLEIKSYLDDGLLIIPNAHLPYNDLSKSLGALHLTVERQDTNRSYNLDFNGSAHYYGNWNNYGNMYLIQKDTSTTIYPDYIPKNDDDVIKFYITATKHVDDKLITTHIVIRPISSSKAIAHIISVNNENSESVVQNDMGELIFTHTGNLVTNTVVECERKIINSDTQRTSQYVFTNYDENITIFQDKSSNILKVNMGNTWADETSNTNIYVNKWIKDKVLVSSDLEKEIKLLKNEINKLKQSN